MTEQTFEAAAEGPIMLSVQMDRPGIVYVDVDPICTRATIQVTTHDAEGPAADAVEGAAASRTPDGLGLTITSPHADPRSGGLVEVRATVPPGSSALVETDAADITTHGAGSLDNARAVAGSGQVRIHAAGSAFATTGTGTIYVGSAAKVEASSLGAGGFPDEARVRIDRAGEAKVETGAGDVSVGYAAGRLEVTTGDGSISAGNLGGDSTLRSHGGPITATVTGAGEHTISSTMAPVHVTIDRSAPLDGVQVRATDPRGQAQVQDNRPSGSPAAAAGTGPAAATAGSAATRPRTWSPKGRIER